MVSISQISSYGSSGITEKFDEINSKLKDFPAVLDKETLEKFQNGEYEITLEEYTDMNTYRTTMKALYGDSSSNNFNLALGGYLGMSGDKISAKDFIQGLEEKGVSKGSALKLYSALRTYTSLSTIWDKKNSFISAKI